MKTIALLTVVLSAAACAPHHYTQRKGVQLRGSLGGGRVDAVAELDGERETTRPTEFGGRLELVRDTDSGLSAGVRLAVSRLRRAGSVDYAAPDVVTENADIRSTNADALLVMRGYLATEQVLRPYLEASAGARYTSITATFDHGQPGLSGSGLGFVGGVGLGAELWISSQFRAFAQVDYQYSQVGIGPMGRSTKSVGGFIGCEVSF